MTYRSSFPFRCLYWHVFLRVAIVGNGDDLEIRLL